MTLTAHFWRLSLLVLNLIWSISAYPLIKIENAILEIVDGSTIGIDGLKIINTATLRKHILKLLEDPAYKYQNNSYGVRGLAEIEQQLEEKLQQTLDALDREHLAPTYEAAWHQREQQLLKEYHLDLAHARQTMKYHNVNHDMRRFEEVKLERSFKKMLATRLDHERTSCKKIHAHNATAYQAAVQEAMQHHAFCMKPLLKLLAEAKRTFNTITAPFLEEAHGTKNILLLLVVEWALKSKREDTYVLVWGEVAEDQETTAFEENMISCKALAQFCEDLRDFMGSLINSCPRACKQAQDLKANHTTSA